MRFSRWCSGQIYNDEKDRDRVPDNLTENTFSSKSKKTHKHDRDNHLGVSPHMLKCTEYQGRKVQMGMCRLRFVAAET